MNLKRMVGASTLATGIGLAGLLGVGLGVAAANPAPNCGAPNQPVCQQNQGPQQQQQQPGQQQPGQQPLAQRGIDQGRQDHQPFTYNGQKVTPMQAGNGSGWGFWFLGQWIPM